MAFSQRTMSPLFFLFIQVGLVAVHELIHTTGRIHQLHLTCIKWV